MKGALQLRPKALTDQNLDVSFNYVNSFNLFLDSFYAILLIVNFRTLQSFPMDL